MSKEINTELNPALVPDTEVNVKEAFGIDQDLSVPAFSEQSDYVQIGRASCRERV